MASLPTTRALGRPARHAAACISATAFDACAARDCRIPRPRRARGAPCAWCTCPPRAPAGPLGWRGPAFEVRRRDVGVSASDPETDVEKSPLDYPQEWSVPPSSKRPDIWPEFEKMETPLPNPMPGDPEVPNEEEEQANEPDPEVEPDDPENPQTDEDEDEEDEEGEGQGIPEE